MKKIFVFIFVTLLMFLVSTKKGANAATFGCTWNFGVASCQPSGSCPAGSTVTPSSYCSDNLPTFLPSEACSARKNIDCGAPVGGNVNSSEINCTATNFGGGVGINTAIGCVPISNQSLLAAFFLRWGLGIGGGIAFLLILVAGFQIMTSRGDPNRLKAGQELMTSAIAGLLLMIFSIFILRLIGIDILGIPGFSK